MTISEPAARHLALHEVDGEANRQLTTLDGWRTSIDGPPTPPTLLPPSGLKRLSSTQRDPYDEDRLDHHARILVVATSFVEKTVVRGRRLVLLNRHAISARRGLMVSGLPGTGKTSAITQLGRAHELLDRARHPTVADRIPVLCITVPPAATARMVAAEFARFLGLPVRPRSNMTDIIEAVVGVCTDTRTGLVIVDEIHNVSQVTRAGGEVSDTLKYFSERIPATFVYAGIGLETSDLLAGTRGAQIAGRFTLVPTRPFPYGDEWKRLVATLENTLLLHDHPPGSLVKLDRYLHNRTAGMIGALSHAIRGAAIDAILNGTERVTKDSLATIPLDHAAETTTLPLKKATQRRRTCRPATSRGFPSGSRHDLARVPTPTFAAWPAPTTSDPAICTNASAAQPWDRSTPGSWPPSPNAQRRTSPAPCPTFCPPRRPGHAPAPTNSDPAPRHPRARRKSSFTRVLEHAQRHIDTLMATGLTPRQIWCQLVDDHDTAISYISVCGYIARQRKNTPAT